jgi:hypothetical protein
MIRGGGDGRAWRVECLFADHIVSGGLAVDCPVEGRDRRPVVLVGVACIVAVEAVLGQLVNVAERSGGIADVAVEIRLGVVFGVVGVRIVVLAIAVVVAVVVAFS